MTQLMGTGFTISKYYVYKCKIRYTRLQGFYMIPAFDDKPSWLKGRGYLHITPKINIFKKYIEILTKVQDENFVARHGFFPLIHSVIKERKFKKVSAGDKTRAHVHKVKGKYKKTAKLRPLHYATHIDSMIFGYYAELLLKLYNDELALHEGLSDCVTAYRKIGIDEFDEALIYDVDEPDHDKPKGKGTIHFAHEAFEAIKQHGANDCIVLMFDIKSFFSEINHERLKEAWCKLLKVDRLKPDHFNVFNAATNFRYILKDELRVSPPVGRKRAGFDERKLAKIRREHGSEAFFGSIEEFKSAINKGELKVYKNPFMKDKPLGGFTLDILDIKVNKKRIPVGIPQGLPISAVLANLYLLEFDKLVLNKVVDELGGFYRRYSDDIMVICTPDQARAVEDFIIDSIKLSKVEISKEKTEKYLFKNQQISPRTNRLTSILLSKNRSDIGKPLTYLGFEFYGNKTLIKSANLAKFYRRMISTVKKKASRAASIAKYSPSAPAVYKGKIRKIYSLQNLTEEKVFTKRKKFTKTAEGYYTLEMEEIQKKRPKTNYFSYINRASRIMKEPAIKSQVRNHRRIFNDAMFKHLLKGKVSK